MDKKKVLKWIGNKYLIAFVVFVVLILFLDENNLMVTMRLRKEVSRLHAEERELKEAIVADSAQAAAIRESVDAKEHYGRENYYMKGADEDVFVVE